MRSSFPSSLDTSAPLRQHLAHPDIPWLLPLPHQSLQGGFGLPVICMVQYIDTRFRHTSTPECARGQQTSSRVSFQSIHISNHWLTHTSSQPCSTGERGAGKEDSQWTYLQGSGLSCDIRFYVSIPFHLFKSFSSCNTRNTLSLFALYTLMNSIECCWAIKPPTL